MKLITDDIRRSVVMEELGLWVTGTVNLRECRRPAVVVESDKGAPINWIALNGESVQCDRPSSSLSHDLLRNKLGL
jgi:hypothetical protein